MGGTFPQAWEEVCHIVVQKLAGTAYLFSAITETIDISEPDYPGEGVATIGGGRVWKQSPQEDGEITLEIYPTNLDTTGSAGFFQAFNGGDWDTSGALTTDTTWVAGVDRTRDRFMVVICWTDDITMTTATLVCDPSSLVDTTKVALRFYAKECRIVSHKSSFTDGILKTTVTFKFPAFNKAGDTKTHAWESTTDVGASPVAALTYSAGL